MIKKVCIPPGNDYHLVSKTIFINIWLKTIQHFWVTRSNSFWNLDFEVFSVWTFNIKRGIVLFVTDEHEILVSTLNAGNDFVSKPVDFLLSPFLLLFWPKQLICLSSGRNNATLEIIWYLRIVIFRGVDVDDLSVFINWTTNVPNIYTVLVSTFHCQVTSIGSIFIWHKLHI